MFGGLFVVLVVAALVPLALGFFRQIPLPGPVLEIVLAVLGAASVVQNPVLVGVILLAASLGLVLPLLADAGQLDTAAGQLVAAGSSLGELTAVVLFPEPGLRLLAADPPGSAPADAGQAHAEHSDAERTGAEQPGQAQGG